MNELKYVVSIGFFIILHLIALTKQLLLQLRQSLKATIKAMMFRLIL